MIGGKDVEIKDYPFMIALFLKVSDTDDEDEDSFLACYSLITTKTALGAAHPIANKEPDEIYGTIGNKDKFLGQKVYFKELIPHPYYKGALFLYDIALLILDSAVSLSSGSLPPYVLQTIALPRTDKEYYSGMGTMVGWGIIGTDRKDTTRFLKAASVSIVNASDTIYKDNPLYVCRSVVLTQQADISMMPGDSGGPLVYEKDDGKRVQIGVLSTGQMIPDGVNVYVSTSFFLDFIKENCEGDMIFA
ncbi:trypsin-4-like [Centruroides vittatus]|uniref:trypsin-4-like n=1 Tax=Centruroides vittatus TaxID=120091 RepID=UPI0035106D80